MNFVELILTVCTLAQPSACDERMGGRAPECDGHALALRYAGRRGRQDL